MTPPSAERALLLNHVCQPAVTTATGCLRGEPTE